MATIATTKIQSRDDTNWRTLLQHYCDSVPAENRYKLDRELDFEHDGVQKHLGEIADSMDEWEGRVAEELMLTKVEIASIKTEYPGQLNLQTRAALQKWIEKFGHTATCKSLLTAFLKAQKTDFAEAVCKVLQSTDHIHPIVATPLRPSLTSTGKTFACPCGNCTLSSYMRQGCDHTQPSNMFPYLNVSLLNESDKNRLLHRLMDEALNMIEMFACLVCDSFKSLDIQNTPISDLVADTLTFGQNRLPTPFLYSHVQELSAAISVRDVQTFLVMHNYISFFNYGILEKIINRFGMPEDITRLECYLTQFHAFCKRSVFEVSQSIMPNISDSTGDSNDKFVVKVKESLWFGHRQSTHNTQTSLTWEDLYAVQRHIAKVLELDPESLLLCDVVKSCVEVTYTFLTKLTITSSQLSELSSLGIKVLCKSKQREDNSFTKFIEERDTTPEKAAYNLSSEIQFGFHAVTGRNISLSDNGLTASRKDPKYGFNAVVYGATPLKSTSEFEVEIESYNREEWHASLRLGVLRTKMTKAIEECSIPRCSDDGERYCLWTQGDEIWNRLNGNLNKSKYGDFNLWEVKCSDRVGMHLSCDGNLTFIVNGRRQGLAARDVYKKGYYVYPVVDVCGKTSTVSITRAAMRNEFTLQELCLERIAKCVECETDINSLPLSHVIQSMLKEYVM